MPRNPNSPAAALLAAVLIFAAPNAAAEGEAGAPGGNRSPEAEASFAGSFSHSVLDSVMPALPAGERSGAAATASGKDAAQSTEHGSAGQETTVLEVATHGSENRHSTKTEGAQPDAITGPTNISPGDQSAGSRSPGGSQPPARQQPDQTPEPGRQAEPEVQSGQQADQSNEPGKPTDQKPQSAVPAPGKEDRTPGSPAPGTGTSSGSEPRSATGSEQAQTQESAPDRPATTDRDDKGNAKEVKETGKDAGATSARTVPEKKDRDPSSSPSGDINAPAKTDCRQVRTGDEERNSPDCPSAGSDTQTPKPIPAGTEVASPEQHAAGVPDTADHSGKDSGNKQEETPLNAASPAPAGTPGKDSSAPAEDRAGATDGSQSGAKAGVQSGTKAGSGTGAGADSGAGSQSGTETGSGAGSGAKQQDPSAEQTSSPAAQSGSDDERETWGDGRDKIDLGKELSPDDSIDPENIQLSAEDLKLLPEINAGFGRIRPGSPNNEELFYANMVNGSRGAVLEDGRCPEKQYRVDLATAVLALKLTVISQKKDDPYTAAFHRNPSGKTWTVVFSKNGKPAYVILNFHPRPDRMFADTHRFNPDFSNHTHSFAGTVGEGGMSMEQLEQRLRDRPMIEDLSPYSVQLSHWFITTSDMHILKPRNGAFSRYRQRFTDAVSPFAHSSTRSAAEALTRNFDFNTNGTVLLIDHAKNGSYLINDDRTGRFHYLDDGGNETDSRLNLCYEDM